MKISNRLKSIADLVKPNDIVADIGCDHALLDIYLIQNNVLNKILASDINNRALDSGIKNIKKNQLENKIKTILSDGIEDITEDINTLIISGMGSSTIIKILSNPKISQISKLIIQSNNDYYLLRKYLTNNNFYIADEKFVEDNNKYYINIVFIRGNKNYNNKELKYGPILMQSNVNYFNYLLNKKKEILKYIPTRKIMLRFKIIKEINYIKRIIKKINSD